MNRASLAAAILLAALAGAAALALRGGGGTEGPPPTGAAPAPLAPPPLPEPPPPGPGIEARAYRSRDEVLVVARSTARGLPAVGAAVRFEGPGGPLPGGGVAGDGGVYRGPVPPGAEAILVSLGGASTGLPLPDPLPPAPPPPVPLLADRSVARPGDGLRVALHAAARLPGGGGPVLRLEPAVPGDGPIPLALLSSTAGTGEGEVPETYPCWMVFGGRVPGDARPGTVVVEAGGERIGIPLVPRWGPPPGPDGPPAPAAAPGDLRLEDGAWTVELRGPGEKTSVLLFAAAGDRFLTHAVATPEGERARVRLPPERGPGPLRVTAVVTSRAGFREIVAVADGAGRLRLVIAAPAAGHPADPPFAVEAWLADGPASPGESLRPGPADAVRSPLALAADAPSGSPGEALLAVSPDADRILLDLAPLRGADVVVRGLALPRAAGSAVAGAASVLLPEGERPAEARGPSWVREGDRAEGADPPRRPALLDLLRVLRPGEAWVPGGPDFPVGPGTRVSWTALSPGAPAGLRIRSGRAILAEERIDGEPRGGTLDGGALLPGPVRVECEAGAAIPVVFAASVHADPAAVPAAPHGDGLALSRDLPGRARAGQVTEIALEVRSPAALEAPVAIRCPLPRGAVPAEDGWTLRGRAPPGTRVEVEEDAVAWRLPSLPAGTTRLAVRVRFAWRGRYGVPPATAAGEDPLLPRARSAGASVVVE